MLRSLDPEPARDGHPVAALEPLLLTPVQAAAALGISRTALYELMGSGALGFVLLGRSRRVPVASLREFVHRELQRQGFQP